MSKEAKYNQLKMAYDNFMALNPTDLLSTSMAFGEFEGLNFEEVKSSLKYCIEVFELFFKANKKDALSWNSLNSLAGMLPALTGSYSNYKSVSDQNFFQALA